MYVCMPGNSVVNSKWVPAQTKYRKYYKSGSTLDIGHFNHATGCEMAHNLRCRPGGGTLYIFGWGCATGTLKSLPYTRPCYADFATLD